MGTASLRGPIFESDVTCVLSGDSTESHTGVICVLGFSSLSAENLLVCL